MQAYTIAHCIMEDADSDYHQKISKLRQIGRALRGVRGVAAKTNTGAASARGLDFGEFVSCLEGDAIDFKPFVGRLQPPPEGEIDKGQLAAITSEFAK